MSSNYAALPPLFVEFVCGPPASGKTTYAEAKRQLLVASSKEMDPDRYGDRHLIHVNLDPANDGVFPYPCIIDICDLIELKKVAQEEELGPNGSYLFCVEYIAQHTDWLLDKMRREALKCASRDRSLASCATSSSSKNSSGGGTATRKFVQRPVWFLVDCPGQVEFYVHSSGLAQLVRALTKKLRCQVSLTHLCDSTIATRDVFSYVSTCLLCLTSMTDIELPQLNVLTKWDRAREQAKDTLTLLKMQKKIRERQGKEINLKKMSTSSCSNSASTSACQEEEEKEEEQALLTEEEKLAVMLKRAGLKNKKKNNQEQDSEQQQKQQKQDDEEEEDALGLSEEASEDEVDEFLETFCNASEFASEHFERIWAETQMESTQRSQASVRAAMLRRCGKGSEAAGGGEKTLTKNNNNNNQQTQHREPSEKEDREEEEENPDSLSCATSRKTGPEALKALTKTIFGVIEGYNLVGFSVLDVQDAELMQQVCMDVDAAIGFQMHSGLNY